MTVINLDRLSDEELCRLFECDIPHARGRARLELARRRAVERGALAEDPEQRVHPVHAMSTAIALVLAHLEAYARAYEREFWAHVGTDPILGDAMSDALRAVRVLIAHSQVGSAADLFGAVDRIAGEHDLDIGDKP